MIAILADDLTSALDGAAPFAARGWSASVALNPVSMARSSADVLAMDLDTRILSPVQAGERFRLAAARVVTASLLYKTVDSTLRGHLGEETRATLEATGRLHAVVAPAFPAAGRSTVGGCQFVDGVPVHLTSFAHDPRTPVRSSRVHDAMQGAGSTNYTVLDAADDGALDALVARVGLRSSVLWVGSPGLGAALARALPPPPLPRAVTAPPSAWRVLVVVGSLHPTNEVQLDALRQAGVPLVRVSAGADELGEEDEVAVTLHHAFTRHPVVCLTSPRAVASDPAMSQALALRAGRLVKRSANSFDALMVTGGDTARRVVDALGASTLDLVGEVEPGVPFGVLRLLNRSIPFATKAGGFGRADTLLRGVERLRGRNSQ